MATNAPARVTRALRSQLLRGIYVIINDGIQTIALTRAVLDAGVRVVQYRAKGGIRSECLRGMRSITRERDVLLLLNDDWRAAVRYDCDGVHLGPEDDGFAAVAQVRAAMPGRLIGLSCDTAREIRDANDSDVDYLGVGPVYATASKSDAGAALGIDGLRRLASLTSFPVAAIGGITVDRLPEIRRTGVAMGAVISAVASAAVPLEIAQRLVADWASTG